MGTRKIIVGLVAAALLASPVVPAAQASIASKGDEKGAAATVRGPVRTAGTTTRSAEFRSYHRPVPEYVSESCAIDLSGIPDDTTLSEVVGCDQVKVSFSITMAKRTVPRTWKTWGKPPLVETSRPHVLSSMNVPNAVVTYSRPVLVGGVELKHREWERSSSTVEFYSGPDGKGTLLGSITRHGKPRHSAKLYGAKTTQGFRSIVIHNNDWYGFGIAQVRV